MLLTVRELSFLNETKWSEESAPVCGGDSSAFSLRMTAALSQQHWGASPLIKEKRNYEQKKIIYNHTDLLCK